jgi:hypothetical protein
MENNEVSIQTNFDMIDEQNTSASASTVSQSYTSSDDESSSYVSSSVSSSSGSNVPIDSVYEDQRIEALVKEVAELKTTVTMLVNALKSERKTNVININM